MFSSVIGLYRDCFTLQSICNAHRLFKRKLAQEYALWKVTVYTLIFISTIINIWYRKFIWTTTFNCDFSYKIQVNLLHLSILFWLRVKCYIPRNTNLSSYKSSDNLKDGNIWILAYSLGLAQRPVCCHFHNYLPLRSEKSNEM